MLRCTVTPGSEQPGAAFVNGSTWSEACKGPATCRLLLLEPSCPAVRKPRRPPGQAPWEESRLWATVSLSSHMEPRRLPSFSDNLPQLHNGDCCSKCLNFRMVCYAAIQGYVGMWGDKGGTMGSDPREQERDPKGKPSEARTRLSTIVDDQCLIPWVLQRSHGALSQDCAPTQA